MVLVFHLINEKVFHMVSRSLEGIVPVGLCSTIHISDTKVSLRA